MFFHKNIFFYIFIRQFIIESQHNFLDNINVK